jgi:serine/threonine protein phosphatase PrpC
MIVASDGVTEFLDNKTSMDMAIPYILKNDLDGACDKLVKESVAAWKREDEVVDDITVIIVLFGKI